MTCQNQINVLTLLQFATKFAWNEQVFIDQSDVFFFGFFQWFVIFGADQKDCSLWERDCFFFSGIIKYFYIYSSIS